MPASLLLSCHTDFFPISKECINKALTMSVSTELGGRGVSSPVGPISQAVKPALDRTAPVEPRGRQLSVGLWGGRASL